MNIAFVIDPWESLNPEMDSTCRLIFEAASRGHTVGVLHPHNLTLRDNVTQALCRIISKEREIPKGLSGFWKKVSFRTQRLPLNGFDIIFVRKNPPLESDMLNLLDSVREDTLLINDVEGIRKASSKIYITSFDDSHEFIPETHVSKDKEYLLSVIEESSTSRMILKPLDGHQGQGVIILEKAAMQNIRSLLDFYVSTPAGKRYVVLQEYLEAASEGDVRILMLNGEPIGAMNRLPSKEDFRGNVHAGALAVKHSLTTQEKQICKRIGEKLVKDGIYLAGVDMIGGKLIEVNVRSPGGITRINKLNRVKLEAKVVDFAENVVRKKEGAIERKRLFRETVQNA